MVLGKLIVIVIIIIGLFYFGNQLYAMAEDYISLFNQSTRDNESKIPPPETGSIVCDLTINFAPKWKGSQRDVRVDQILFLNQEGGKITWSWSDCHVFKKKIVHLALLDLFAKNLSKLEFVFPTGNYYPVTIKVSFGLVDKNSGLKKELPHHQEIPFKIGTGFDTKILQETIVYREIERTSYTLVMTPVTSDTRFADHDYFEPYKQQITP